MSDNKTENAKTIEVVNKGKTPVSIKGAVSATYEGPLPPPDILRGFAEIYPDSVQLIFDEFEKNSDHVRQMEKNKLQVEAEIAKRGQWMAFVIGIVLMGLAGYAAYIDAPWIAGGALFIAIAGVAKSISKDNKKI